MDSSPGKPESNRKIADILHDHGDDLSRVREIDHWAYFPSDEARAAFIAARKSLMLGRPCAVRPT